MNRTHLAIAQEIRTRIRSPFECLPMGSTVDEWRRMESDTMQATGQARYLVQHLAGVDRVQFLKACGIRAS